jgi:membrane protein YdbS with pleckstrin-like domain
VAAESIGKAYKPVLLVSVVVLVGSLGLLAIAMTVAFLSYGGEATPLWVIVLAAVGALGLGLGFAGLFLILATAGWRSWRETRRVQVISPAHSSRETNAR